MSFCKIMSDVLTRTIHGEKVTYKTTMYVPEWITASLRQEFIPKKRHFWNAPEVLSAAQLVRKIQSLDLSGNKALIYAAYPEELGTEFMETFYRSGSENRNASVLKTIPAALTDMKRKVIGNISGKEIRIIKNERLCLDSLPDYVKKNWKLRAAAYPFTNKGHSLMTKEKAEELISIVNTITARQLEQHQFASLVEDIPLTGLINTVNRQQKPGLSRYVDLDSLAARFWRPEGLSLEYKDREFDQSIAGMDIVIPSLYRPVGLSQRSFEQIMERTTDIDQLFITGIIDEYPTRLKTLLNTTKARHIFMDRSVLINLRTFGWERDERVHVFNYQDELTRKVLATPALWEQQGTVLPKRVSMFDLINMSFWSYNIDP